MNLWSSMSNWFSGLNKPSQKHEKMVVVNHINVRPITRDTQDVQKWRDALRSAEGSFEQRSQLYNLYADIILDPFLSQCIEKRIRAITNRRVIFQIKGKEQEQVSRLTNKTFFKTMMRNVVEAQFYGHSLIELDWSREAKGVTKLVDRRHVKPRLGIVAKEANDVAGIPFRKPPFNRTCIEAGNEDNLGAILEVAFPVILKRGNFGNWADFAEVFGMPFRHAKYFDESTRETLEEALKNMGAAGYLVTPNDAEIEFSYPAGVGQGVDIFQMFHKTCNEEIAIGILGNSMTTVEAKYGGYAQGKVQSDMQDEIHKDDREFVLCVLNESLTPYLQSIGFAMGDGEWHFEEEETLTKKEKLELGEALKRNGIPVGLSWWYETSGIPMPSADDLPILEEEEDETDKEVADDKTKKGK